MALWDPGAWRSKALRSSAPAPSGGAQRDEQMSGFVVWMTGLSGAGKSTLASLLTQELSLRGVHVECLDGDEVRQNLSHGLGFSREDRDRNVRRIGYVARMVARSGSCAITAAISPYRALRDEIRSKTENFLEVYCECPLEVLTERDPKGLYKRALAGEIKNFTGVDDPYEAPENPEVLLHTDKSSPRECVGQILAVLEQKGLFARLAAGGASLPVPFGGEVFEAREATELEFSSANCAIEVTPLVAQNIAAVAAGYFSPVGGFMSEREAVKVEKGSALEGGTPWWSSPFVLPISPGESEPEETETFRLTSAGESIALGRVAGIWTKGSERLIAGPLEAVREGSRTSPGARSIRKRAREQGWRHIVSLFPLSKPSDESMKNLAVAQALADGVIVAAQAKDFPAWSAALDERGENTLVIQLPDDFPSSNPRAQLVVQKSVGASASLLVE